MMNVAATTTINALPAKMSLIEKGLNGVARSKFFNTMANKQVVNPNFYPNFVLALIILQNLVGTATYTAASWTNKGMPKEQRKFAAAIDLMNGLFNFGIILTIGRLINNKSDKWAEAVAKPFKDLNQMKNYDLAKVGFRSFLTIVVAGVFVQRVIVPFFATPAAKWFKEKYLSNDKTKSKQNFNGSKDKLEAKKLSEVNKLNVTSIDKTSPFAQFETFQNKINTSV